MILPDTIVQWIDVKTEKVHIGGVSDLYRAYAHKANHNNNTSQIMFDRDSNVKITDSWGWTDVICIKKFDGIDCVAILNANGHQLRCHHTTLIPFWDIHNPVKGFHGEMKYPFEVATLHKILAELMNEGWDGDRVSFIVKIRSQDSDPRDFAIIKISDIGDRKNWSETSCYQIITKSGFYNANDIVLWGKEKIPENYCEVCKYYKTQNCVKCRKD